MCGTQLSSARPQAQRPFLEMDCLHQCCGKVPKKASLQSHNLHHGEQASLHVFPDEMCCSCRTYPSCWMKDCTSVPMHRARPCLHEPQRYLLDFEGVLESRTTSQPLGTQCVITSQIPLARAGGIHQQHVCLQSAQYLLQGLADELA